MLSRCFLHDLVGQAARHIVAVISSKVRASNLATQRNQEVAQSSHGLNVQSAYLLKRPLFAPRGLVQAVIAHPPRCGRRALFDLPVVGIECS